MREEIVPLLVCLSCGEAKLSPGAIAGGEGQEIREGQVVCAGCGREYRVKNDIADLLHDPSPEVAREKKAWDSLRPAPLASEEERRASREWLLALPMLEGMQGPRADIETWRRHGRAAFDLCAGVEWRGRRALELGAGRCWLSAHLAREGAEVVAVDILETEDIGLGCGEAFINEGIYFERVLCDMHRLPFRAASFDAVVATATLHHSHDLPALLGEIARVLVPGGLLLAANEPLYVPWRETPEEERKGAHEGSYSLWTWLQRLRRAGFEVESIKVGLDASIHIGASYAVRGGSPPIRELLPAMGRYGYILALALPRKALGYMRRLVAGRPMRPPPQGRRGYLQAGLGRKEINERALPAQEVNWGPGWYGPEGGGKPFRWCGPRARLLLPSPGKASLLVLELASFNPALQSGAVEAEVRVGKKKAGSIVIDHHGWQRCEFKMPAQERDRPVHIALRVKRGYYRPSDMGLGDDRRLLGLACRGAWWEE